MKKKFFKVFFAIAVVSVAGIGVFKTHASFNTSNENALLVENAEAQSWSWSEWWNRLDYVCEPVQNCVWYAAATVPKSVAKGTGTVAHFWDCITCDDMAPKYNGPY